MGYYGLFHEDVLNSLIIPDLNEAKAAGWPFEFPVLIVSYDLGKGDTPEPLPKPPGRLTLKSAGGVVRGRRMMGIPVRRNKIPVTEEWLRVIDAEGRSYRVEECRLTDRDSLA